MELNSLKYFYFVAKEGGFTKASKVIRIAQPAITKMVKNLEQSLGVDLFERHGRTVRLTKIGNDVYRKCEIIFGQVEGIAALCRPMPRIAGPLNLAAAEPIANYLVPDVLTELLRDFPSIYPQVTATTASDAMRLLAAGKVEGALLFHAPDLPDGLEIKAKLFFPFKLVIAKDKAHISSVCESFIGSREVDDISNRVYPTLTKLQKIYPSAEIKVSTNSLSAHRKMVLNGLGVSILPEFMVREDLAANRLTCLIEREDFRFALKVVGIAGKHWSAAATAFIKLLSREERVRGLS